MLWQSEISALTTRQANSYLVRLLGPHGVGVTSWGTNCNTCEVIDWEFQQGAALRGWCLPVHTIWRRGDGLPREGDQSLQAGELRSIWWPQGGLDRQTFLAQHPPQAGPDEGVQPSFRQYAREWWRTSCKHSAVREPCLSPQELTKAFASAAGRIDPTQPWPSQSRGPLSNMLLWLSVAGWNYKSPTVLLDAKGEELHLLACSQADLTGYGRCKLVGQTWHG